MEVHHHSHTERKKWYHYLWEFFMLFLAVTAGFLVENLRERRADHHREKQYMASLLDDLKQDTAEIQKDILQAEANLRYTDSVLLFLHDKTPQNEVPVRFVLLDS